MGGLQATVRRISVAGSSPAQQSWSGRPAVISAAVAAVSALHAALTWRYTTLWYTDVGGWFSHVERVSQGEVLYRDVGTVMPPFSVWLLSLWARAVGTDVVPLLASCLLIFGGIGVAFGAYCAAVIPRRFAVLAIPIGAAALLLALGHAPMLASGSYHPAVPLGFLLLLAAVLIRLRRGGQHPALLGVLAGLVALTKHDYWVPAAIIVAWEAWDSRSNPRRAIVAPAVSAAVFFAGIAAVAMQAGWPWVVPAFTGFGAIGDSHGVGRQAVSWERLVLELGSLSAVVLTAGILRMFGHRSGRVLAGSLAALAIFAAVYIAAALSVAGDIRSNGLATWPTEFAGQLAWDAEHGGAAAVIKAAVRMFATEILTLRFPSILLPITLLIIVAVRWRALDGRRTLLTWLLVLAAGLRARRGFEYTDWYQILLEIPVYALALDVIVTNVARRAVVALTVCLIALGAGVYRAGGVGPLTREGAFVSVETARGTVRWAARHPNEYVELSRLFDRFDPDRDVPVFNLGHNGGIAYWTGRASLTHAWIGLFRSPVSADSIAAQLRRTRPLIAVRPHMYDRARVTEPGPLLRTWSLETQPTGYLTDDLAYFERIVAGCERMQTETGFTVYFCDG